MDTQPTQRLAGFEVVEGDDLPTLRAWAPSMTGLLEQAARGLFALMELEIQSQPREQHALVLQADEAEDLIAGFLSELLYVLERDELGFDEIIVQVEGDMLRADLQGGLCVGHGRMLYRLDADALQLASTPHGLEALIPFAA